MLDATVKVVRFARKCRSHDGGVQEVYTVVVPLVCSRVSEEGAATTISVNVLGLIFNKCMF